jgi:hypothetical protein
VPTNNTTAIALPAADIGGTQHHCHGMVAEHQVNPGQQRVVLDEHMGFHFHVLADADPGQHDDESIPGKRLTGSRDAARQSRALNRQLTIPILNIYSCPANSMYFTVH